jgi:hypothetical protein
MNKEARNILVTVALCLVGGLLAINSPHGSAAHAETTPAAVTPASFARGNAVFALAESVVSSKIDTEPMWPAF